MDNVSTQVQEVLEMFLNPNVIASGYSRFDSAGYIHINCATKNG